MLIDGSRLSVNGFWSSVGDWDLGFGFWNLSGTWNLEFGIWNFKYFSNSPTTIEIFSNPYFLKYYPATAAVSGQPSKVVSLTSFPAAIATEEIPTEVPNSRADLISK